MANITTEADVAKPAVAPQPHIYAALQFSPVMPDGCRRWIQILVPAINFDQALATLRAEQYLVGDGETYLLSDHAAKRGPLCKTFDDNGRCDTPTVEQHANWVSVMTRGSYEDGEHCPATYIRVH